MREPEGDQPRDPDPTPDPAAGGPAGGPAGPGDTVRGGPDPAPPRAGGAAGAGAPARPGLGRLLWDHAGRLGAAMILLLVLVGLLFLAVIGYSAALALLIVLIVGLTLIIAGGKIRA